jgi:hypothetical protein
VNWLRIKLNKDKQWLFNLESKQLADLGDYLCSMVHGVDYKGLAATRIITVKFELLNLTLFTLDITRLSLHAQCDGYNLGLTAEDNTPKRQVWGQRSTYSLEYHITNMEFLSHFRQVCSQRQKLNWTFHITWDLQTALYQRKLSLERDVTFVEMPDVSLTGINILA